MGSVESKETRQNRVEPYEKVGWVDHVVDKVTGDVLQQGLPVNQTNLTHMDDGIERVTEALNTHEHSQSGSASALIGALNLNTSLDIDPFSDSYQKYQSAGSFVPFFAGASTPGNPWKNTVAGHLFYSNDRDSCFMVLYRSNSMRTNSWAVRQWYQTEWSEWRQYAADDHTHTAGEVGAAAADHSHIASEVGAAPTSHNHSASNITTGTLPLTRGGTGGTSAATARTSLGAAAADHTHTASEVGAAPTSHNHSASNITSGTLPLTRGGTGGTSAATARTALGAAAADHTHTASEVGAAPTSHTHSASNITSGTLPLARGGTGGTTASTARTSLGAAAADHTHTASAVGAAPASHSHSATDITSGTLPVNRGGTGKTTHTSGYALVGSGTSAVTNRAITATPSSGSTSLFTAGGAYTELAKKVNVPESKIDMSGILVSECTATSGSYYRKSGYRVEVFADVYRSGGYSTGHQIATFPVGFRPSTIICMPCGAISKTDSHSVEMQQALIYPDGKMYYLCGLGGLGVGARMARLYFEFSIS